MIIYIINKEKQLSCYNRYTAVFLHKDAFMSMSGLNQDFSLVERVSREKIMIKGYAVKTNRNKGFEIQGRESLASQLHSFLHCLVSFVPTGHVTIKTVINVYRIPFAELTAPAKNGIINN